MNDERGFCPNCYKSTGKVWDACTNDVCKRQGYHLIPENAFQLLKSGQKKRDLMVGQVLDNRYLLVQRIGSGGMGSVLLGLQKPFNRKVAVKIISSVDITEQLKARFEREARALSQLDHPNIVKLMDYGIQYVSVFESEIPFMVLEYVEQGMELGKFFKKMREANKQVSRKTLLHIFSQVLDALGAAHARGMVHRDIKPANIMLKKVRGNPFFVKILDFGLAKAVGGTMDSNEDTSLTQGMIVGTPQYMAPEQGKAGMLVDQRTDLYAVGSILFEAICGVQPFTGNNAMDLLLKKIDPQFDPFNLPQARTLPDSIRSFLQKAMAPYPDDRFPDATAFKDALQQVLTQTRVQVQGLDDSDIPTTSGSGQIYDSAILSMAGDSDATLARDSGLSRPWPKWVIAGLVLGLVLTGAFFVWPSHTDTKATKTTPTQTHQPAVPIRMALTTAQASPLRRTPVQVPVVAAPKPTKKRVKPGVRKKKTATKRKNPKNIHKKKPKKGVKKHGWKFFP